MCKKSRVGGVCTQPSGLPVRRGQVIYTVSYAKVEAGLVEEAGWSHTQEMQVCSDSKQGCSRDGFRNSDEELKIS